MSRLVCLALCCALAAPAHAARIAVDNPPADPQNYFRVAGVFDLPGEYLTGWGVRGLSDYDHFPWTMHDGFIEWSIYGGATPFDRVPAPLYVPLADAGFSLARTPYGYQWANVDLSEFIAAGDTTVSILLPFLAGIQTPATFTITSAHLGVVTRTYPTDTSLPEPGAGLLALLACGCPMRWRRGFHG